MLFVSLVPQFPGPSSQTNLCDEEIISLSQIVCFGHWALQVSHAALSENPKAYAAHGGGLRSIVVGRLNLLAYSLGASLWLASPLGWTSSLASSKCLAHALVLSSCGSELCALETFCQEWEL